jgi:alanine racemase
MLGARFHYDLVRPGYALYGGQAFRGGATPVGPVVSVAARILQIRDVPAGATVGYSATWKASRPSRVAVVAAGYADGFARCLSGTADRAGGVVGVSGQRAPVIGRVSMDLITVDVTGIVPPPQRGDFVDLIGHGLTIEAMGTAAGTIGYEVLTRLGSRFHRVYLDGT